MKPRKFQDFLKMMAHSLQNNLKRFLGTVSGQ